MTGTKVRDLIGAVDQLLAMLRDSPKTEEAITDRYPGLMWAIDGVKEARHALKSKP